MKMEKSSRWGEASKLSVSSWTFDVFFFVLILKSILILFIWIRLLRWSLYFLSRSGILLTNFFSITSSGWLLNPAHCIKHEKQVVAFRSYRHDNLNSHPSYLLLKYWLHNPPASTNVSMHSYTMFKLKNYFSTQYFGPFRRSLRFWFNNN